MAACRSLELVLEATSRDRVLVVAPPEGPHHVWQASLADCARRLAVQVFEPVDVNNPQFVAELAAWSPHLVVPSVGYTQIIPQQICSMRWIARS